MTAIELLRDVIFGAFAFIGSYLGVRYGCKKVFRDAARGSSDGD